jgi:hypothetical protein
MTRHEAVRKIEQAISEKLMGLNLSRLNLGDSNSCNLAAMASVEASWYVPITNMVGIDCTSFYHRVSRVTPYKPDYLTRPGQEASQKFLPPGGTSA